MKIFKEGLLTGLILQIAIGPVFFYLINLTLQRTIWDGLVGVVAVTIVDYLYIFLAIFGIGKLIEKENIKKVLSFIGPIVLIVFGIIMIKESFNKMTLSVTEIASKDLISSFTSTFMLTILSPMTIFFWTGIFATKTLEYNYSKNELLLFGLSTGLATLLFMSFSVTTMFLIKEIITIPLVVVQILNFVVGCLLILYGGIRLKSSLDLHT